MSAEPMCSQARQWLSAFRDGETLPDPLARRHIDACADCTMFEDTLAVMTRRFAVRPAGSPDVTSRALAAWSAARVADEPGQQVAARVMLALAGVGGLALAVVTLAGASAPAGSHFLRDLIAFECALAVGFLLSAWRPERYLRGLLPVAGIAGLLTLTGSAGAVAGTPADLLAELSHLPVLLGLFGLFVLADARHTTGPRRRQIA